MAKARVYNPLFPLGLFASDFRRGDILRNKPTGDYFIVTKVNGNRPCVHVKLLKRLPEQIDLKLALKVQDIAQYWDIVSNVEYLLYGQ